MSITYKCQYITNYVIHISYFFIFQDASDVRRLSRLGWVSQRTLCWVTRLPLESIQEHLIWHELRRALTRRHSRSYTWRGWRVDMSMYGENTVPYRHCKTLFNSWCDQVKNCIPWTGTDYPNTSEGWGILIMLPGTPFLNTVCGKMLQENVEL